MTEAAERPEGPAGMAAGHPRPPREPSDPEAIRKYCGRTSVSGLESSSRSYEASSAINSTKSNSK